LSCPAFCEVLIVPTLKNKKVKIMNKPQLIAEEIIEMFAGTTADDDGEIASVLKNYLMHLDVTCLLEIKLLMEEKQAYKITN
jgi:hypothetical protein